MKPFKLLPLYLRREPTVDPIILSRHFTPRERANKRDVVAYVSLADAKAKQPKARWSWHLSTKPRRRRDTVTLNCYRWQAIWLPDLA